MAGLFRSSAQHLLALPAEGIGEPATMKLLDLFCGAGGAAMGYYRAGFTDITGVDIRPQKRYPFRFVQADALEYLAEHGHEYDAIHASPPCQRYTRAQRIQGREHPDLIAPTRDLLIRSGKPYVIENVPGAPMRIDLMLCGSMFGLRWNGLVLYRHRWFETGGGFQVSPFGPAACCHDAPAISIFGHTVLGAVRDSRGQAYKHPNKRKHLGIEVGRKVMGIDWMTREELSEAIPPVYTEWIGRQLIETLRVTA